MRLSFVLIGCIFFLFSCSNKDTKSNEIKPISNEIPVSGLQGKDLATIHCARCHSFVEPSLLTKSIWKNDVLPNMGLRMGVYGSAKQRNDFIDSQKDPSIIREANIFPKSAVLARADWNKIVQFYIKNAPDTIPAPKRRANIKMGLKHFKYREVLYSLRPPLTVMAKILPDNEGFVYSDGRGGSNTLVKLNSKLEKVSSIALDKALVQYHEKSDTLFLTSIGGNLLPTDTTKGELLKVYKSKSDSTKIISKLNISKLQRPVFMAYGDLNNSGLEDVVVCEFGNETGKLSWFENKGNDTYEKRILRNLPGAIKSIIKDVNGDGLKDIVALMAQADEAIFLYENRGDGTFIEKRILSFSPLFGSQNIELIDINKDGFDDIIYVCGDNADKTPILKDYHGIYIYLNDGKFNFTQTYFYQMNGAYKAMVHDYDLDGDFDIAGISFFPDYVDYPEESFIYLENKGDLNFVDYSFPESTNGRWMVMDAADMDGDGDVDLALGSFVYFKAKGDTTGLGEKWFEKGPSMIVLENTTR